MSNSSLNLGVDFTFAWDNHKNHNPHLNYVKGPVHYHSINNTRLVSGSIKNNGHTAQLDVIETLPGDVGVLTGGPLDSPYQVLQLHFHWGADDNQGSEHTLDGQSFPMELHIVHKKVAEDDFL